MAILKNNALSAVVFVLMLTIAASVVCLPTFAVIPTNVPTSCWLSLRPNPVGVGQELLINGWRAPPPYMYETLNMTPPAGVTSSDGLPFDFRLKITKPDGTKLDLYPIKSDGPGTFWLSYVVDQKGNWTFELSCQADQWFQGSSVTQTLTVQDKQVPSWPDAKLPTEPWTYPINYENREWSSISGGWFMQKYNASACNYNPYTQAPRSPHILWTAPPASGMAGIIGGPSGNDNYYSKTSLAFSVVMAGRAYSSAGGRIYCYDVRTGQQLWNVSGSFNVGSIRGNSPALYQLGTRFIVYDGLTGAMTLNVTGMSALGGSQGVGYAYDEPYVYSRQNTVAGGPRFFIKWTTAGTSTNFTSRIIWNTTWPEQLNEAPHNDSWQGLQAWGDTTMFQFNWPYYGEWAGFNLTSGKMMWNKLVTDPWLTSRGGNGYAYGLAICPIHTRQLGAWNTTTGALVWKSEMTADPWGNFFAYQHCAGYGMIYKLTYAGAYAFNATNGKIVWYTSAGDAGMETPYAIQEPGQSGLETPETTWPFYNIPALGDGVFFAATGEHSPTSPYLRGQRLYAMDAFTGKGIWNIMGYWDIRSLAEGTLFATNTYDGNAYAFAKGTTQTTVSASSEVASKGSGILIKGTIMDMSPAQPNTPAVSDDSMSGWMEYLHMQQPKPTNTTGVKVHLTAVDSKGSAQDIGYVTSDVNGGFSKLWTPPAEGEYTIYAKFEGSNSYYSSSSQTYIGVTSATNAPAGSPAASPTSPATTTTPSTTTPATSPTTPSTTKSPVPAPQPTSDVPLASYITIVAAAIIAAAIIAAFTLKRRKQ